jgi:hypothetical protein
MNSHRDFLMFSSSERQLRLIDRTRNWNFRLQREEDAKFEVRVNSR